jgi:hypothetical protein
MMKRMAMLFILLCVFSTADAASLVVLSDMSLYDGVYDGGSLHNGSTLDMYGGTIGGLFMFDDFVSPDNVLNLYAGSIASLNIAGGELNVFGGSIVYFGAGYGKGANLYGGNITAMESVAAPIHVYGYDFQYIDNPGPIGLNGGQLVGYWEDHSPFSIECYDSTGNSTYYDHVILHEIPDPATLLLLALGAVLVRRKREKT